MKKRMFSLISVVMLIVMILPTASPPVVAAQAENGQTATNSTSLVADFVFDVPDCSSCAGVTFTDKTSGGVQPYTHDWDFGDGSNSTEPNPRHRYAIGTYTVTLTVTDSAGDIASKSQTVTVGAATNAKDVELDSGVSVTAVTSSWPRCNSGCTANDAVTVEAWIVADPYCTPGQNNTAELWLKFVVTRAKGPYCAVAVMDVYVDDVLTYDEYTIDIGDLPGKGEWPYELGEIVWPCGSELELRDIYVQWMMTDDPCLGDCKDYPPSKCWIGGPLYVHTPLVADFEFSNVCYSTDTTFTDTTTGGVEPYTSWYWDFGDGSNSTAQNPAHHYGAPGTYSVTLTVTDSDDPAHSDSQSYDVTVYEGPTADFSADVFDCCDPLEVQFTDLSTAGDNPIVSWYWEFGDGATSTDQHPSHTYDDGTYTVSLTVTDSHGCSDIKTEENYITSNEDPTADFSADVFDCCDPLEVQFTDESIAGDNIIVSWYWEFGDGYTSTDQHPSHTYDDGTYTVSLTVTDSHGCSDTETKPEYITSNEGPTADFTSDVQSCCDPLTVHFTDQSTAGDNPIVSWYWEFGDGATSTDQDPSHAYDAGTYTVTLTVTDSHGCTDTETKPEYITSNEGPTADFSADVFDCCDPLEVQFTDLSTAGDNPIVSWYWEFGDGATSTDQHPSHTYDDGTYTVSLTVTDSHGCTDTETKPEYITSNEGPTADFTSDVQSCCDPLTVHFTDQSTAGDNPIVSWYWEFGDGATSTDQDPSHAYSDGVYTVSLTVTDSHGCTDTETKPEYITSNEGPTADFSADVFDCCDPLEVQFTDLSTAGDNPIVSWYWEFGDGDTSTDPNPSHTYSDGVYTVSLTVTDYHGCSDTETKTEYITSNEGPTADFTSDVQSCCDPLTVHFTDQSTAGDNPIVSWYWEFGDGATSTDQDPSHAYDAGTYTVTLTVTDSHGCTDTETKPEYITSNEGPTADFSADVFDCCDPLEVQFTDLSTAGDNPIVSWYWEFGDGDTSTDPNPSHTYSDGVYTVSLTVTDYHGCSDTETKTEYITSNEGPTADFTSDVQSCCDPLTVHFTDQSTAGDNPIVSWYWEFGDGATSTDQDPSHAYDAGTYTVTLTVTDSHGCTDTETKPEYITSNEGPTADFSADVFDCCDPLEVQFTDLSTAGDNPIVSWYWEFGDGDTSTDPNPSHTYSDGVYTVSLTVTDYHGCSDTETKTEYITSNEGPTADFTSDVQSCCDPLTVHFTDQSTAGDNPIVSWYWEFGDGATSTDQDPSHAYDAGTYTVTLTVTDSHGCTDTETKPEYITSNEGPTADFSADVFDCCDPLEVQFTDLSTAGDNPIVSWYWEFGDGATSTDQHPSHTYDDGTYTVSLTVTDSHGCSDTETKPEYITSNEGPTADFSADVFDCCDPLEVQFTDLSTAGDNPIVSWYWEFGDGATSTDQHPSHTYDDGTYTVSLTVTDSHGCSDTETKPEYITSNEGPTADFSADVFDCCDPLEVQFTDLSTAGDNPIVSWYWEFGDGYTSTDQHPSHTYDDGTYTVSLTVTDSHGCSDTETKPEYITSNEGPTADFSADVFDCCDPLEVQFTDLSTAGDNPIVSWYWEFGDGYTSTDQHPSHTYDDGTYTVSLTVTDSHGCTDTETKPEYITSNEGPTADFSADVFDCCDPLEVQFTDLSTAGDNPIVSWYWEFGDGATSTDQHPSHTYDDGTYTVSLTVTDSHGCTDTETKPEYITSNEGPTADFSADVTGCSLTVQFTDESIAGDNIIVSWYWEFGDGYTSTDQHPSHTYDAAGAHNVTLTVTDYHGCNDSETKVVTVYASPTATASSNSPVLRGATIELYGGPDDMASYNWTGPGGFTSTLQNPTRPNATTAMAGTYTLTVTSEHGCTDDDTTNVVVTVPRRPPPSGGGGRCPIGCARFFTVDWDENITTTCLPNDDRLAEDMLCPDPDGKHNLFLEQGTLAPEVDGERHYLIVIRELEEEDTPPVPDNTMAVAAFNITPAGAVFEEEIFLTLAIDQLPDDAVDADIFYYDEAHGVWVPLDGDPVDPNGVAELSLSAGVNHFTVFAVLVDLAPPAPPAHFVPSGLSIVPSVERIWEPVTFVTRTGESATITANVANDGGQGGTYVVELKLNGEAVDTKIVTLDAGQSQQVSFTLSEMDYGQYEVEVAGLSGEFTTSRTITWWLIIVIIAAIGLIIWGAVWARRRRRARQQA